MNRNDTEFIVQKIRTQYMEKDNTENDLDMLRELDAEVKRPANLFGYIFGSIAAVLGFYLMYDIDKWSVLFVVFPILGNFVFNRKLGQIDFNRNKDMAPHNRRTTYVNRVMYLAEYAKEVRNG